MQESVSRAITTASNEWRTSLIDVGGNNRLLYFRPNASTIQFDAMPESASAKLYSGKTVRLNELFVNAESLRKAQRACTALARKQREAQEEFGVPVAFMAVGTATWDPTASEAIIAAEADQAANPGEGNAKKRNYTLPSAPVLLRALELSRKRGAQDSWELRLDEDFSLNSVLVHVMNADRFRLDEESILDLDNGSPQSANEMLKAIEAACRDVADFRIESHHYLGAFTYLKQPMVADIDNLEALASSDLVSALAGDPAAASRIRGQKLDLRESGPDYSPVDAEFLILDADSSQSYVINAAVGGSSLVVQGPPGTGKSQTIANTIASLVAADKKVLFVAQKRAAITAVLDRLKGAHLEHLVLDLFAASSSRRFVADELRNVLELQQNTGVPDVAALEFTMTQSRDRLVSHNDALSKPTRGWGVSVSWLRSQLPGIPPAARSQIRLPATTFTTWTASSLTEFEAALDNLLELGALEPQWHLSPGWNPQAVNTREAVSNGTDVARDMSATEVPSLLASLAKTCADMGVPSPSKWPEIDALVSRIEELAAVQNAVPEALSLERTSDELHGLLCATDRAFKKASAQRFSWKERRQFNKKAAALNPALDRAAIHQWIIRAVHIRDTWNGHGVAQATPDHLLFVDAAKSLRGRLARLQAALQHIDFDEMLLADLAPFLQSLANHPARMNFPRAFDLEARLSQAGLATVVGSIRADMAQHGHLGGRPSEVLRWVVYSSILEDAEMTDPGLAGVSGRELESARRKFIRSDMDHMAANSARIRRLVAERLKTALDHHPEEHATLKTELTKKRNFRSVRTFFSEAPTVIRAAKPVWAMSPLQVSRLLPAEQCFDVVIFDEASQIKPSDAIPALLRANQAIVAGDSRQLPPTEFFSKVLEDLPELPNGNGPDESGPEEDGALNAVEEPALKPSRPTGSLTKDAESILFAMERLLVGQSRSLLWHYRSRDERLIAVSNAHVYSGSLTTFPAADALDALRHVAVEPSEGIGQTTNSPVAEVEKVVQLVKEHVRERPTESLGVIAFGIKHQNRIEMALDRARVQDPEFEAALSGYDESFFVKSIERVQGDERDAIILTVGYGKGIDGKMRYLWGPLLKEGGERRLNVAISRARRRMTLVSSFTLDDIAEDAHASAGFKLMYRFLRFVSSGGKELHGGPDNTMPLNPFEIDVRDRLTEAGLQLDAQVGVGAYRIDFAVRHPDFLGRHILAIEADGASYHSGHVARERDRLRQDLLERRGWTFHRIWSTDWFNNAEAEVRKVQEAVTAALAHTQPDIKVSISTPDPSNVAEKTWRVIEQSRTKPKPHFTPGNPIRTYPSGVLLDLVMHIRSDGKIRSAEDELLATMKELGFSSRGRNIVAAIEGAQRNADLLESRP